MTLIEAFCACSGRSLCHAIIASFSVGKSVETAPLCSVAGRLASLYIFVSSLISKMVAQDYYEGGTPVGCNTEHNSDLIKTAYLANVRALNESAPCLCRTPASPFFAAPYHRYFSPNHQIHGGS